MGRGLLEQALPSLFPFSLPPPPPLFAPATQASAVPKYEGMEARSGQSHDNKIALQVSFNPTAVNIMDLLHIFVINKQYLFQRVSNYF